MDQSASYAWMITTSILEYALVVDQIVEDARTVLFAKFAKMGFSLIQVILVFHVEYPIAKLVKNRQPVIHASQVFISTRQQAEPQHINASPAYLIAFPAKTQAVVITVRPVIS